MRVARASLLDHKRVDNQGFKFRARVGVGPDESGLPGYVGARAGRGLVRHSRINCKGYAGASVLVTGRPCITPGQKGQRVVRLQVRGPKQWRPARVRGTRAILQERTAAKDQGLKLCARGSWTTAGGDRKRHDGRPVGRLGVWPGRRSRAARIIHRRAGVP